MPFHHPLFDSNLSLHPQGLTLPRFPLTHSKTQQPACSVPHFKSKVKVIDVLGILEYSYVLQVQMRVEEKLWNGV